MLSESLMIFIGVTYSILIVVTFNNMVTLFPEWGTSDILDNQGREMHTMIIIILYIR